MNICIYGASSAQLEQIYYDKTEELGKMMAKRGHGLVFGGGATGMMGSAARGVDVEGGYILGIAPRFFDKPGTALFYGRNQSRSGKPHFHERPVCLWRDELQWRSWQKQTGK